MDVMHAFRTSVDMNSRTSAAMGESTVKTGIMDRSTRVMSPQARVSCIRKAWVQNKMTDLRTSGVPRTKMRNVGAGGGESASRIGTDITVWAKHCSC